MYKFCPHCGKPFVEPEARTVSLISQVRSDFSWADVLRWQRDGTASQHLKLYDEVHETLKNGEEVVFVVVGVDVYQPGEVLFGLKDCLKTEYAMNEMGTNAGGWNASALRRVLNSEILELLPDDLRACIKPRMIDGETSTLWLFSEMEVFGENDWTENDPDRGVQLPYFVRKANRVKGLGKDGPADGWWERSPSASSSTAFCLVNSYGYANAATASYSWGVAFGFRI